MKRLFNRSLQLPQKLSSSTRNYYSRVKWHFSTERAAKRRGGGKRENGRKKKFHRLSRPLWSSVIVRLSIVRPSNESISGSIRQRCCINRAIRKLVYTRISASSVSRSCARVPITNTQTLASSLGSGYPSLIELSLRFVDRSIRRKQSVEPSQILRTATSRLSTTGQLIDHSPHRGGTIQSAFPRIRSSPQIREQRLPHFSPIITYPPFRSIDRSLQCFRSIIVINRVNWISRRDDSMWTNSLPRGIRGIRTTRSDNRVESRFEKSNDLRPVERLSLKNYYLVQEGTTCEHEHCYRD